jgi:hypothetical protein
MGPFKKKCDTLGGGGLAKMLPIITKGEGGWQKYKEGGGGRRNGTKCQKVVGGGGVLKKLKKCHLLFKNGPLIHFNILLKLVKFIIFLVFLILLVLII